jgi:aspartyl-tRNA(Asn)/glutamyl-tRNA(Gln) amidotransferase subunit A
MNQQAMNQMPSVPLWQLSATELAEAYRAGTTTPETVLEATLARIVQVNPHLNAIVTLDAPGARAAAHASTQRWRSGSPLTPLDGVPVTIKDNILVRGMRSTWGSKLYAEYLPSADETPVARLCSAGAVILGKTNVPEFTLIGYTDNQLFGPTRNPWNLALTPGGSSGGAVAAVAAGLGPIALATDGGGSIRRPAAHTGLVGFKPSRGMVPRHDGFPVILHDFEVVGPIARTVDDVVAAMDVISGPHWHASAGHRFASPLRVLFIPSFSGSPVDPAIADAVAAVAIALARQGHRVETLEGFDLADPVAEAFPVISQAGLAWVLSQHGDVDDRIAPALSEIARAGRRYSAADYVAALEKIRIVERRFDALFERAEILLAPATAAMPWPAQQTHPPTIAGTPVGARGHAVFTPFANALGLPAISLPCEAWHDGMPIGFQLCAAHGHDRALLEVARLYEASATWRSRWPDV